MVISSTDAKNRFGQVLGEAQKRPVVIEKSGRRHSVVLSAEMYDGLVARAAAASPAAPEPEAAPSPAARAFYAKYKDWVDEQNRHFEQHGIWNEELRSW